MTYIQLVKYMFNLLSKFLTYAPYDQLVIQVSKYTTCGQPIDQVVNLLISCKYM